jgi:4-cresol dehydrogenase (hydroxylating) flavoprotein subunit
MTPAVALRLAAEPATADGPGLAAALSAWEAALGSAHVVCDPASLEREHANVSAFERRVHAVLLPASTEEVQAIVRIARLHRVPLNPLSTGKNWGLGSRLPVRSGSVTVDLRRMNAVRELNANGLYATVEPGVTQRQLHRAIVDNRLPVTMNVTGSSADSSILGNALERGIGYFGSRADETYDLEVVLGNGELLRTGFRHQQGSVLGPLYRHGIGPSIDGLFFQSSFGIVTAATVALRARAPEYAAAVVSIASEADLPALIDALAAARRAGHFESVVHIGDRSRTRITLAPLVARSLQRQGLSPSAANSAALALLDRQGFGAWSGLIGLSGSAARIRAAVRGIRACVRGFGRVRVLSDRRLAWARRIVGAFGWIGAVRRRGALLDAITPLYELTRGVPTDAAVESVAYAAGDRAGSEPDHGNAGMLYCLPLMPLSGSAAHQARNLIRSVGSRHEIETSVTFNLIDARVLEAVVTIPFSRADRAGTDRAQRCNHELRRRFIALGFTPYRVDIDAMGDVVQPSDPFWRNMRALKAAFDPDGIIAPGRYNLD